MLQNFQFRAVYFPNSKREYMNTYVSFLTEHRIRIRKDTGQTYISVDERSLDSFGIPKGFPLFAAW